MFAYSLGEETFYPAGETLASAIIAAAGEL